jgi:hypothetical protein
MFDIQVIFIQGGQTIREKARPFAIEKALAQKLDLD